MWQYIGIVYCGKKTTIPISILFLSRLSFSRRVGYGKQIDFFSLQWSQYKTQQINNLSLSVVLVCMCMCEFVRSFQPLLFTRRRFFLLFSLFLSLFLFFFLFLSFPWYVFRFECSVSFVAYYTIIFIIIFIIIIYVGFARFHRVLFEWENACVEQIQW